MVRPRPLGSLGLGQVAESARQAQESPSLIFLLDTYWVPPPHFQLEAKSSPPAPVVLK